MMKSKKLDRMTLIIDRKGGARVILRVDSVGNVYSEAYDTTQKVPWMHEINYTIEKKRVDEIWKLAAECKPFSLEEKYFIDGSDTFEMTFFSGKDEKKVLVVPAEKNTVPEKSHELIKIIWKLNRW